ncbi:MULTISPECIES: hypothetical protein [Methylobacteriaceae]|uniref:hypothetical protein n=1 Tax=Methylobacteriaceae TaxID=119045 RepID=UPI00074FA337|nr:MULTISPECIES: hypothetical protein [Methylobacteriaceae]AMB43274.1 hypothetical protein Y590_00065 [Methylobacterium sp. AMS5]TFZ55828.1 hypothetical protein E4V01_21075 [Methylorubrum sp. Q1]
MPVFDGKYLTEQGEGEALLAMVLRPTPTAQEEARARGRMRIERATMLAELVPAVPGTTLGALKRVDILPVN